MVSLEYDEEGNALYIRLKRGEVAESEPISDNLVLDLNGKGEIIGVEILVPKFIDFSKLSTQVKIITKKRRQTEN
ncbi:MAG: DUF2283 domain-containing protein [Candidatus Bathyarchaeota archaeon]|nr:DUF2283 domain-containing protein [Candidatus Bathyarchaeota archaeon A05DMB-3]MDH7607395.1 DUF2283 domain-containing protein [Candidatus Bathyarchaeota archaeon]